MSLKIINTSLIKKFQEFIHKIKNTNLFIKFDIFSLQSTPHRLQRTHPALDQSSKHFFLNWVFGLAVFDFFIISSWLLKRVRRSDFLSRLNWKKSQRAKSVEFGGCWMVFVSFLVKKLRITTGRYVIPTNPVFFGELFDANVS